MSITTEKIMTPIEFETFKSENEAILAQNFNKKEFTEKINLEIPSYSSIDGTTCAGLKLGSLRRKPIIK